MTKTNIIIYRGHNIESTNYGDLTSVEVFGNYTGDYENAEKYANKHLAEKLTADILKEENSFNMRVHLQDQKWIHMGVTEQNFSSINECIEYMKRCIDRYLFRE